MEEDYIKTEPEEVLEAVPLEPPKRRIKRPYLRRTNRRISEGEKSLLDSLTSRNNYLEIIQEGRRMEFSCTGPKVGPGYYNTSGTSFSGSSHYFSTTQRFEERIPIKIEKLSKKGVRSVSPRMANLELKKFLPQFRAEILIKKKKDLSFKRENALKKRLEFELTRKNRFIESSLKKEQRFFFNQNRIEIYKISNS